MGWIQVVEIENEELPPSARGELADRLEPGDLSEEISTDDTIGESAR
jgi:hypothetical protein